MNLLLAALALLLPLGAYANELDWNSPRLAPPSSAASIPGAEVGRPADPQALELSQFKQTVSSLKRFSARVAAPGVFEIDLDPGAGARFINPDMAALSDGRLLLDYSKLHASNQGFEALLGEAGVYQRMDAAGVFRYYRNGTEIGTFEAYSLLATENFLDMAPFKPALTGEERGVLREGLRSRTLIPLPPAGAGQAHRIFNAKTRALTPLPRASGPMNFLEFRRLLDPLTPASPGR